MINDQIHKLKIEIIKALGEACKSPVGVTSSQAFKILNEIKEEVFKK